MSVYPAVAVLAVAVPLPLPPALLPLALLLALLLLLLLGLVGGLRCRLVAALCLGALGKMEILPAKPGPAL